MRTSKKAATMYPRPLPFMLTSSIPYKLDAYEFPDWNLPPVTNFVAIASDQQKKQHTATFAAHIAVGGQAPILGKKRFSDLSNAEQNIVLAHEMLHVLISYHPYLLGTTQRLDRFNNEESNIVSDIVIDYCATLFRSNYLFGAMTGFRNAMSFHHRSFMGGAKSVDVYLKKNCPSAIGCRFLYMEEFLLQKTNRHPVDAQILATLSTGAVWSQELHDAHDKLCSNLLDFGAWVKQTKYDFLGDPELTSETDFILRLRDILEEFIKSTRKAQAQQNQTQSQGQGQGQNQNQSQNQGQNQNQGQADHTHTSFGPDAVSSHVTNNANAQTIFQQAEVEKNPEATSTVVSTGSINPHIVQEQAEELLDHLDDPFFGCGISSFGQELVAESINHNVLLSAKREVTHFMDHTLRVAIQDPTGVQGESLVDGTEGSFHFNTTGAIQAVQGKMHPSLFRSLATAKIKRKTILAVFDVSSSMEVFNRELKPWLSAFFISNLHTYFTIKVVDFACSLVEDHTPYNKAALCIRYDGGTDPFAFRSREEARSETWTKIIHDAKPDAIIFVSDMEFDDEGWNYNVLYRLTRDEIKKQAETYLPKRFDAYGFHGTTYPIIAIAKKLSSAKDDARAALRHIINDHPISY